MSDLLILLDSDIKRCEEVLKDNNYLEIVIAVEELLDKYKDNIEDIGTSSDRVWNYSKKDLENIMDKLKVHRNKFIDNYNESRTKTPSIDLETMFNKIISQVKNNKELSKEKIEEVIEKVEFIKKISDENIGLDEKWDRIRQHIIWISSEDLSIGTLIIFLVNGVFQNR